MKNRKVNVVQADKKNTVKKKDERKPGNTTANKPNEKGKVTFCAKCQKKADHETHECPYYCKWCYQALKKHKKECWYAPKNESVKVAETEKE